MTANLDLKTKQSILIVDDVPINIEILDSILSSEYEILFATSGKEALEIANEQVPDLVLLDVIMPEMDGYQVCKALRDNEKTKDIPVIIVTTNDQEEDESKGFASGVVDYIIKPVRSSIVKARVRLHLELKSYREYLKHLSAIDGLTGIANRRTFDDSIVTEWRRARRSQSPISLIMMDIDDFKSYNDCYGHLKGDECLRKIAGRIREVCRRPADLVARFGGEEFVIVLPDTDSKGANFMARRAQQCVNSLAIPHRKSRVAEYVTLSLGVVTAVPDDQKTYIDFIHAADEQLYSAKRGGRNQIKQKEIVALDSNAS